MGGQLGGGGGVPRGEKKKVAQNLLKHALVLEFLKSGIFFGGVKKKSCSEFAETCSRFGIFEIRQFFFLGGGIKK